MIQTPIEEATQTGDSPVAGVQAFWTDVITGGDVGFNLAASAVAILVVALLRRLLMKVMDSQIEDVRIRYKWQKGSAYAAFFLSAIVVLFIWTQGNFIQLGTFLGLLTAGLAIALKDLVANLAGWIFIIWRRPFDLGDRIAIAGYAGDVVDVRVFQFTILEIGNWVDADQSTGRIIHIPNQKVFSDPQANYTSQFEYLWHEIPVLLTFESDWRKAKEILRAIADEKAAGVIEEAESSMRRASRKFLIFYQKLTPIVYTTVKDAGVLLTIRYLSKPRARRGTSEGFWEAILDAFAEHDDIDFAYPTHRAYFNALEGKEGARTELGGGFPGAGGEPPDPA